MFHFLRALEFLKDLTSYYGTRPLAHQEELRSDLLGDLIRRVGTSFDAFRGFSADPKKTNFQSLREESKRMTGLLDLMLDYVKGYDSELNSSN